MIRHVGFQPPTKDSRSNPTPECFKPLTKDSRRNPLTNFAIMGPTINLMLRGQSLWLVAATVVCNVLCWLREEENFCHQALPLQQ
jgi:hypothetical protein